MVTLILANFLQVGVEGRVVSSAGEFLLGELAESLLVEGVLEVLKRQRVVEDIRCISVFSKSSLAYSIA